MTAAGLRRSLAHAVAVVRGDAWRTCATCGTGFSGRAEPTTTHLETIPGGEDDPRLLCPGCIDAGVGCRAHAAAGQGWMHKGCEVAPPTELWPTDDTDAAPGRSGPYYLDPPTIPNIPAVPKVPFSPGGFVAGPRLPVGPEVVVLLETPRPAERRTRAEEREAREAVERQLVLDRHADLLATIPDIPQNSVLRALIRDHAPKLNGANRLECRGCARVEGWVGEGEYEPYWPDAPCPTWSTIERLHGSTT
ncbi:hypothetical protein L3Q65_45955 [Amycolatopsis sp. FU40]|uniref:hypothetical protein n=1 Tax=Amycolatopsis sp. FU40 TaxID=2914159 RepID=UPI001F1F0896|nr:hypothetical protein [Amycolatopsis sp. FU40]UKD55119.1 hypothetical protein L3Q65_45955 [Amycolatopsis sp. FU40]